MRARSELTRAQAERLVARTDDEAALKRLADHRNAHVRAKVAYKLLSPEDRPKATGIKHLARFLVQVSARGGAS
jgi:hypothetical protein